MRSLFVRACFWSERLSKMTSSISNKKSPSLVVYVGNGEIAIGPLISEKDLVRYFFTEADRDIDEFDRAVLPYSGDMDGLVAKAKEVIKQEKEKLRCIP